MGEEGLQLCQATWSFLQGNSWAFKAKLRCTACHWQNLRFSMCQVNKRYHGEATIPQLSPKISRENVKLTERPSIYLFNTQFPIGKPISTMEGWHMVRITVIPRCWLISWRRDVTKLELWGKGKTSQVLTAFVDFVQWNIWWHTSESRVFIDFSIHILRFVLECVSQWLQFICAFTRKQCATFDRTQAVILSSSFVRIQFGVSEFFNPTDPVVWCINQQKTQEGHTLLSLLVQSSSFSGMLELLLRSLCYFCWSPIGKTTNRCQWFAAFSKLAGWGGELGGIHLGDVHCHCNLLSMQELTCQIEKDEGLPKRQRTFQKTFWTINKGAFCPLLQVVGTVYYNPLSKWPAEKMRVSLQRDEGRSKFVPNEIWEVLESQGFSAWKKGSRAA